MHRPLPAPGGHSLAELAVGGPAEARDAVEVGWRVSPVLLGDDLPRLFVHRLVAGRPCWTDCRWTPWSSRWAPGDALDALVGRTAEVGLVVSGGRWWVWFEGEWLGFFEAADWQGRLDGAATVQWYGEVHSPGSPVDGEMGNGRGAADPAAARVEAMCQVLPGDWTCRGGLPAFVQASIATRYGVLPVSPDGFRYGGR
ncbi:MAG TPA: neprosin family prolyl endopeptidase [Myxococcaceae bacterium]|nr:neprosin family prolyl endopeptidase [Myxococcaceae bacterium]